MEHSRAGQRYSRGQLRDSLKWSSDPEVKDRDAGLGLLLEGVETSVTLESLIEGYRFEAFPCCSFL